MDENASSRLVSMCEIAEHFLITNITPKLSKSMTLTEELFAYNKQCPTFSYHCEYSYPFLYGLFSKYNS